jgi:methylmalonyl-CoA epimerase
MPTIKRIDHIAIVVDDLDSALAFWRDSLGLELQAVEDIPEQGSIVAFMPAGGSEVELVKPTTDDSGVAKYLKSAARVYTTFASKSKISIRPGGVSQKRPPDQRRP